MSGRARKPEILGIIPVSGQDPEFKRGLPTLGSRSLLEFTFDAVKSSRLIGRAIVATDDQRIADASRNAGIEVPFLRPPGTRLVPIGQTLLTAVEFLERQDKRYRPDWIVRLQVTFPFREPGFVDRAIKTVLAQDVDSAFVAFPEYDTFWKLGSDQTPQRITTDITVPRVHRVPIYRELGGLFSMVSRRVIAGGVMHGEHVGIIPTRSVLAPIDLHAARGLDLARVIAEAEQGRLLQENTSSDTSVVDSRLLRRSR